MRKIIAGGVAAAAAAGIFVGCYELGESINDNPEGSHGIQERELEAAYAGYIALAGDDECEATVLTTLSTLQDEWYEPPKSASKTQKALVESCPDSDHTEQEILAEDSSQYFRAEVAPAISAYDNAVDAEDYSWAEKMIYSLVFPVGLGGLTALAGAGVYSHITRR